MFVVKVEHFDDTIELIEAASVMVEWAKDRKIVFTNLNDAGGRVFGVPDRGLPYGDRGEVRAAYVMNESGVTVEIVRQRDKAKEGVQIEERGSDPIQVN